MASLNVQAPDGKTLTVDVPPGTDPSNYGALADDALSHYTTTVSQPSEGKIGSFLRGIANQMPLGNQFASLVSKGPYSQNLQAIKDITAQDKAQNPVSYGAGAVTGAVAPAAIPGVGELMVANPMTAGAIMGGANAISDTDIQKHPLQAAVQAGTGASTGALLSGLINKIAPPVQNVMESKANDLANKSINMPSGVLGDMTEEERQSLGSFLRNQGLVGRDKQQILNKATELEDTYGQKIGEIGTGMTKQGLTVEDSGMLTQPLVDKAEQFAMLEDPEANSMYKTYMAGAKAISSKGENPSWSDLQGLKQTYGDLAFKSNGEIKNKAAADVYFTLSGALKDIATKASQNPNISTEYQQALAGYSRMSPIVSGLTKEVDSELRGGPAHMGVHLPRLVAGFPGWLRAPIGVGALAAGHPLLAAAAALPEVMSPAIQSKVVGGIANAMPAINSGAQRIATQVATNPQTQAKVADLIKQLKAKYDARRQM